VSETMEYVFFDLNLAQRFKTYCEALDVATVLESDQTHSGEASFTLKISDTLPEELIEQIEEQYSDLLFGEQAALYAENESTGALADACGVQVQLQSGAFTTVAVHPEIMNKILSVLSVDELQRFLSQIVEDIENPKMGAICARKDLPTI